MLHFFRGKDDGDFRARRGSRKVRVDCQAAGQRRKHFTCVISLSNSRHQGAVETPTAQVGLYKMNTPIMSLIDQVEFLLLIQDFDPLMKIRPHPCIFQPSTPIPEHLRHVHGAASADAGPLAQLPHPHPVGARVAHRRLQLRARLQRGHLVQARAEQGRRNINTRGNIFFS